MGRRCRASIHSKANDVLKNYVFPSLREDDVVRSIRYDEIVILFANLMCDQYRSPHKIKIDEKSDKEIYNSLSEEGKKAAQSFVRIVIRGKLGRTVGILLNKLYFNCVKLILQYRETAGVVNNNPYVFGMPNKPGAPSKYLEACTLMRIHSVKCKALKPHLLRGTILRKHIAT